LRRRWQRRWARRACGSFVCWTDEQQKFLAALAKDLKANAGKSAVIPGLYQDASVRRWPRPSTARWATPARRSSPLRRAGDSAAQSDQIGDFKALVADLNAGKVDWLVILNSNPIYSAPADLDLPRPSTRPRSSRTSARIWTRRADRALAHSGGALSGVVVGCAGLRRHGFDCAAADRSALWRQDGARCFPALLNEPVAERL
jgi:hypothetical protein